MPAQSIPKNSVWTAMSYTPPRGRCNYKASLIAPACPCLRFMLHPVKAATSFECDGCAHHASFHLMENAGDDAVVRKWTAEEKEKQGEGQATVGAGRKRRRITDKPAAETVDVVEVLEITEEEDGDVQADGGDPDWWYKMRNATLWTDEQREGAAASNGRRRKGKS